MSEELNKSFLSMLKLLLTGKLGPAYCLNVGTGGGGYLCCGGPEAPVFGEAANLCAMLASCVILGPCIKFIGAIDPYVPEFSLEINN